MSARALVEADFTALKALRLEGIRLFPQAFLLTEAEALAAPDAAALRWIASGNAHGVLDGDTLVGFAGLSIQIPIMARHRAHMGPFYVTPEHQGTGAGDQLLQHLFDVARTRGATQMELDVALSNPRARAFYARQGFAATGRIPAAVIQGGTPQDDLMMVADLTQPRLAQGPDGLRRLHAGDWRIFRDIRLEMLHDASTGFGATHAEWAGKAPDEFIAWLRDISLWAVVENGRVVATAGWHPFKGEVVAHRGHVIAIYTTPQARGRRLSQDLLAAVVAEAREQGITQLELDVGAENAPAIAAYEAAGFRTVGTIPNCLNHSGYIHDQLYMVRPLTA